MNEDQIVDSIADSFQKCLAGANKSRVFKVQTLLPGVQVIGVMDRDPPKPIGGSSSGGGGGSSGSKNKVPEHKLVRTDSRATTLDSFLVRDVRPLIDETATATISTISKVVSGKNGDDEDDKDVVMISSGKVDVITIPDGDDDFMILENDERSSANKEGVETGAVTSG